MDHVDLPSLAADATAEDAIKAMKDNSCSAVVVARISGPAVLGIDIITYTLRLKGNVKIKNVKPRDVTINLSEDSFAEDFLGQLETGMPDPKKRKKIEDRMDSERAIYAFVCIVNGRAKILTRHEENKYAVNSGHTLWRCRQNPRHIWRFSDLVQPGNKCMNDDSGTMQI